MSNDLAVRGPQSALAIADGQTGWTAQQLSTLEQLGVAGAGEGDLAVFFHQSVRTGLDPFAKQIYMIARWSSEGTKWTIQTGIDGYRLIARRAASASHEVLEYEDTMWCGPDGRWRDVWLSDKPPAAAKVTVLRNGGRFPAIALWNEYVQTKRDGSPTAMWSSRGAGQLAKCAEALALRKAFPQDLSGIYTDEEMGQADARAEQAQAGPGPSTTTTPVTPPRAGQVVVDGVAAGLPADQADSTGRDCAAWQAAIAALSSLDEARTMWREAGSEALNRDCDGIRLDQRLRARMVELKEEEDRLAGEAAAAAEAEPEESDSAEDVPEGVGEPIVRTAPAPVEAVEGEVLPATGAPAEEAEPQPDPEDLRRMTGQRRAVLRELSEQLGGDDQRDGHAVAEFRQVIEDVSTVRLRTWMGRLQTAGRTNA